MTVRLDVKRTPPKPKAPLHHHHVGRRQAQTLQRLIINISDPLCNLFASNSKSSLSSPRGGPCFRGHRAQLTDLASRAPRASPSGQAVPCERSSSHRLPLVYPSSLPFTRLDIGYRKRGFGQARCLPSYTDPSPQKRRARMESTQTLSLSLSLSFII